MTFRTITALMLGIVALLLPKTHASVTIIETGQEYATRPDSSGLGKEFWRGYEYMGRLQWVYGNLPLCDDSRMFNVTVPYDGLYVALVVRGGGCSLEQKLKVASNNIQPAGVVKYVLIDGKTQTEGGYVAEKGSLSPFKKYYPGYSDEKIIIVDPESDDIEDSVIHKSHKHKSSSTANGDDDDTNTPDFPLYVLHISYKTEYALLDTLLHQSEESRLDGGPRVALDSRLGTGIWSGPMAVWLALCIFMSACACSCLIVLGNETFLMDGNDTPPAPPVRRERRRLTREQVRKLLPVYQFPGQDGPLLPEFEHVHDIESAGREALDSNAAGPLVPPQSHELDVCSICLDEYEPGDRLRCLPCRHVFHGNCIGKWLHERSATCPLCKIDLWEEEVEESDDDDDEEASHVDGHEAAQGEARQLLGNGNTIAANAGGSSRPSWWSRLTRVVSSSRPSAPIGSSGNNAANNNNNVIPLEQEMTETHIDNNGNNDNTADANATAQQQQVSADEDFPRGSWWRRMFPLTVATDSTSIMQSTSALTEPLLLSQDIADSPDELPEGELVRDAESVDDGDYLSQTGLEPGQVLI